MPAPRFSSVLLNEDKLLTCTLQASVHAGGPNLWDMLRESVMDLYELSSASDFSFIC